mmetsp:Transcript_19409/g.30380  ORF Transcript_19409/g.30380 Transcript_19409/m.30380 type:complete len:199 (+) Transcript_19409:653-1249(+)
MRNQKKFTKTDVVKGNLNPAWPPMQLKLKHVDGNPDAPIRIECMDWDRAGSDELIGYVDTTPRALCQSGLQLPLVDPKSSKLPGSLRIDFFAIVHKPQRGYGHRGDGDDHDGGLEAERHTLDLSISTLAHQPQRLSSPFAVPLSALLFFCPPAHQLFCLVVLNPSFLQLFYPSLRHPLKPSAFTQHLGCRGFGTKQFA